MVTESQHHWQRLHDQLRGIAKRRATLDAEEARCLREADRTRLWERFGYVHMNEYLERELGYGPQVGIERLRVAHALAKLPLTEASLGEGALPYSAVRELTRVATLATERAWLAKVRGLNLRQIEALVSGKRQGDGPDDPPDPEIVTRVLRLELVPSAFAMFRQAQHALADEHGGRLDDSAFIEVLCRRALEGSDATERPAHQIAFTTCESCGRGWQNAAGRDVEVGPEVIERAGCDAEWLGSLSDDPPARVTATVTARLRRQVFARDHYGCTVPGCRSARNLELHHVEYRQRGGTHALSNLTLVCSGHHQQLHEGALVIRGTAPDALEFAWPNRPPPPHHDVSAEREGRVASDGCGDPPSDRAAAADVTGEAPAADPDKVGTLDEQVKSALEKAGYNSAEASAAVKAARPHVGADAPVEQHAREALRRCQPANLVTVAKPDVARGDEREGRSASPRVDPELDDRPGAPIVGSPTGAAGGRTAPLRRGGEAIRRSPPTSVNDGSGGGSNGSGPRETRSPPRGGWRKGKAATPAHARKMRRAP